MAESEQTTEDVLQKLYREGLHTDVVIRCGENAFAAHKAILCAWSPVFATALSGKWKENLNSEIVIAAREDSSECVDPVAVELLLQFLYQDFYDIPENPYGSAYCEQPGQEPNKIAINTYDLEEFAALRLEPKSVDQDSKQTHDMRHGILSLHVRVHDLADRYNIPALMSYAISRFAQSIKSCTWHDGGFSHAASLAFDMPPMKDERLRTAIVEALHSRFVKGGVSPDMRFLLEEVPDLTFRLYLHGLEQNEQATSREPSCDICKCKIAVRSCTGISVCGGPACKKHFISCGCKESSNHCANCTTPSLFGSTSTAPPALFGNISTAPGFAFPPRANAWGIQPKAK